MKIKEIKAWALINLKNGKIDNVNLKRLYSDEKRIIKFLKDCDLKEIQVKITYKN